MKITQEVREYAKQRGLTKEEALIQGMDEKSIEFLASGGDLYRKT